MDLEDIQDEWRVRYEEGSDVLRIKLMKERGSSKAPTKIQAFAIKDMDIDFVEDREERRADLKEKIEAEKKAKAEVENHKVLGKTFKA